MPRTKDVTEERKRALAEQKADANARVLVPTKLHVTSFLKVLDQCDIRNKSIARTTAELVDEYFALIEGVNLSLNDNEKELLHAVRKFRNCSSEDGIRWLIQNCMVVMEAEIKEQKRQKKQIDALVASATSTPETATKD